MNDVVDSEISGNVFMETSGNSATIGHPQHVHIHDGVEDIDPMVEDNKYPVSYTHLGILKCGLCNSTFHRHKEKGENRWYCYHHRQDKNLCPVKAVLQKDIYTKFLVLYNKLANNTEIISDMLSDLHALQDKVYFSNPCLLYTSRCV